MIPPSRREPLNEALLRLAHDAAQRRLRTAPADAERHARAADEARLRAEARVARVARREPRPDER